MKKTLTQQLAEVQAQLEREKQRNIALETSNLLRADFETDFRLVKDEIRSLAVLLEREAHAIIKALDSERFPPINTLGELQSFIDRLNARCGAYGVLREFLDVKTPRNQSVKP